jgi:uncharacterized membrane protein
MTFIALGGDRRRDIAFTFIVALLSLGVFLLPTGFPSPFDPAASQRVKARILSTDESLVKTIGPVKDGSQQLELRVEQGSFKGRIFQATNNLVGKLEFDKLFAKGDMAFVVLDLTEDRRDVVYVNVIDHYRLDTTYLLLGAFALVLIAFAGWTGLKTLISFVFSGAMILKILLPLVLRGYSPILIAFGTVGILTFVIIFLVGGFTRKGLVAFIGSMGGVTITSILAILFTNLFKIHGAVRPFSETLLYSGYEFINLQHLFMAGIFLASSGAVIDLAMDISAAMHEVVEKNPSIPRYALVRSGFAVGRAVVGTQTTTLLLAYSGGYTALIMTFIAQGVPLSNIINMLYVSAELVHTMVGSFGLVLVAPITALAGGVLYKPKTNGRSRPGA